MVKGSKMLTDATYEVNCCVDHLPGIDHSITFFFTCESRDAMNTLEEPPPPPSFSSSSSSSGEKRQLHLSYDYNILKWYSSKFFIFCLLKK